MDKYRCTICDYIYDPEVGDPETELNLEHPSTRCRMTGCVRFAG
jgi:rubredoxin